MTNAHQETSSSDSSGSTSRPTVRLGAPDDLPEIVEVFDLAFDAFPLWPVSEGQEGFVRWMTENSGSATRGCAVAVLDGKIVGASVRQLRPALVHGERLITTTGPYVAMHPIARGKGFYRELRSFEIAASDIGFGFSQVAEIHHLRLDEDASAVANPWDVFVSVQHPLRSMGARAGGTGSLKTAGYVWLAIRGRARRRRARTSEWGWSIAELDHCDRRFDELYARAASEFDFILQRDHEFLNWRYFDRRGGRFTVLVAETDDELLGYAAVTVVGGRGHIADLLVLPGREDVARSLIEAALDHCAGLGTSAVECSMMRHHPYTPVLRDAGFVRLAGRSSAAAGRFALRPDAAAPEVLQELRQSERARIHLTEGDSELI